MLQIKNTLGGGKPEGLYVWKKYEIGSELKEINESVSTLPYSFYNGCAVVLNGEIHILGGSSSKTSHYKWNGSSWVKVSTLPYNFYQGLAVVLNGEIHILGGYDTGVGLNHYKWNGSSWVSVSTLPYVFYDGSAVVLNNEIHILGSDNAPTSHYKWDGSSWVSVSTLPYNFYQGSAVVLNNEIHIFGGNDNSTKHYKFDGTTWASVSTLPYGFAAGSAVVFDDNVYILGSKSGNTSHYKWNGSTWTKVSKLPYAFYYGSAVVFNNGIYLLGSGNSSYYTAHYLIIGYVPAYTFLDYIVSDKETAYPDGGEKGGYWYEKVGGGLTPEMFGCTKMAIEDKTYSSNTSMYNSGNGITHSLGVAPKVVILLAKTSVASEMISFFYNGNEPISYTPKYIYSYISYGSVQVGGEAMSNLTDSKIVTNGNVYLKAGVTYTLITMA